MGDPPPFLRRAFLSQIAKGKVVIVVIVIVKLAHGTYIPSCVAWLPQQAASPAGDKRTNANGQRRTGKAAVHYSSVYVTVGDDLGASNHVHVHQIGNATCTEYQQTTHLETVVHVMYAPQPGISTVWPTDTQHTSSQINRGSSFDEVSHAVIGTAFDNTIMP